MKEKINNYPLLSPAEQLEVEHYVNHHPEMEPLLEQAKALGVLLQDAKRLSANPLDDEVLAYFIATRRGNPHGIPTPLREAFAHLEARLAGDPALQARHDDLVRRMDMLEAAHDPVAQFERLTGHRIPRIDQRTDIEGRASRGAVSAPSMSAALRRPVVSASRFRSLLRVKKGRQIAGIVVGCLALYGALVGISHFSQAPLVRLATFERAALALGDGPLRGRTALPGQVAEPYRQALDLWFSSRTAPLGLFPRYNRVRLIEAVVLLERVIASTSDDTPSHAQANYLLAQIYLVQQDEAAAREALQAILDGSGWRAPEARMLLEKLEALPD